MAYGPRYISGSDPNDSFLQGRQIRDGFQMKRGKIVPRPRAAWDAKDGDKKGLDAEAAQKVLDEALR